MSDQATVVLRPYRPDTDAPFVYSTWRNSAFYGSPAAQATAGMPKLWFREKTRAIRTLLDHASIFVACLSDDPDAIIGYSVVYQDRLHLCWMYVKANYRGQGVGRMLWPPGTLTVTDQLTTIGKAIVEAKGLQTKEDS